MKVNTVNEAFSAGFNVNSVVSFSRDAQLTLGTVGLISNYPMPKSESKFNKRTEIECSLCLIMFVLILNSLLL